MAHRRVERVIGSFALSFDGRTIAAIQDLGATSRLRLLDAEGRVRKTPSLPPGVIGDLQWHPKRAEVAFSLGGSRAFNDVCGGYAALAAAIEYGHRLRGVNPAFGITDFPSYLESTELSRQANRNAQYGDPADPAMREFLTRISPLRNVSRLTVPTFVAAGARDTRVPVAQAEMLVNALKTPGTPVWYVRFEQAGHLQLTAATNDFAMYTGAAPGE